MTEWFYGKEGQQFGPFDETTLRARITSGEVGPNDLIWCSGMSSWQPLKDFRQFAPAPQVEVAPFAELDVNDDLASESAVEAASPYAPPEASLDGASYQPGPGLPLTNSLAIASMVCGILSLVFFCFCGGLFLGVPAVICGYRAKAQLKTPDNGQNGDGMATAGIICGYLGIAVFVVLVLTGKVHVNGARF